ncbi:MAG TPA: hypothetical protein VKT81_24560 [Bryobacteraceae bacterium]|nr:hypothetical protein [Bryobacteraceae bacterium]
MRFNQWMKLGAIGAFLSLAVWADHGGKNNNNNNQNEDANGSFESSVVGSTPGATIGGVNSGGAPWVAANGEASVSPSGKLEVDVRGLLLGPGAPANLVGTVGPVQMVAASLVCGGSGGVVAASTEGVPLSTTGRAHIEATVTAPATCVAPAVLVRVFNNTSAPGSQLGPFIAVTGFNMSAGAAQHATDY